MKVATAQKIVISNSEMEALLKAMKENQRRDPAMSDLAILSLCIDTDYNTFRIDTTKTGEQFSSYAECNSFPVKSV
jgi:hypothetical protein